ncbi:MAG: DNA alkylation repair protein [Bryobacteraceae bacterium]
MTARVAAIVEELRGIGDPRNVAGMARFGIVSKNTLGISVTTLRRLAKPIGRDQKLAEQLWKTGIHEARVLACFVAEPDKVTGAVAARWVRDFDNWAVCDAACYHLFDKTDWAWEKAREWAGRDEEFVKRAGFAVVAAMAVHDKSAPDAIFRRFLPLIRREATDERNFVKKAVNWALRQIGKRNPALNAAAIAEAERIAEIDSRAARWVAKDALRELRRWKPRRGQER